MSDKKEKYKYTPANKFHENIPNPNPLPSKDIGPKNGGQDEIMVRDTQPPPKNRPK